MAIVTRQSTGAQTREPAAIQELLSRHGMVYERWNIDKLAARPQPTGMSAQEHILDVFSEEVDALRATRGYKSADVIALTPDTENLDELLAKFDKEHTHSEDEVRFTVSGRGIFTIRGVDNELYDIEMHPGDLIVVPEGTKHYFTLCDDRQIQCIRLFTNKASWVAQYVDEELHA